MKPKTGEVGAMVPVSEKNQKRIAQFDYVSCVRPWFVICIIHEKLRISKLKMDGFPITANYRLFPGKLRQSYPAKKTSS